MCSGNLFNNDIKVWRDFREAAASGEHGFEEAPTRAGVYVLRVRSTTSTDLVKIIRAFDSSRFMQKATALDEETERFFGALGFGVGWGWKYAELSRERLERVSRIPMKGGELMCPIIYVGKANSLWRRMTELAMGGHTANAPVWALLMAGWQIDVGFATTRKKAETAEERRLKDIYREHHKNVLPPFVQR